MKLAIVRLFLICLLAGLVLQTIAATDRFILIPDASGTTGSIVVTSPQGSKVIKKPYTIVKVDELGNFTIIKSNVLCVDKEFDDALAVIPKGKEYKLEFSSDNMLLDLLAQSVMRNILAQINATPIPFATLTGDEKWVAYVQKLLLDAKIPNLTILLDIVTNTENKENNQQVLVSVK